MADTTLGAIKAEILFFMDKLFQSSFAYAGALIATFLTANFDGFEKIAGKAGISKTQLVIFALLSANSLYLTFAASCSFAVIKRGLFILETKMDKTLYDWEVYIRRSKLGFSNLSWNVDNYYVAVYFLAILLGSIVLFIFAFAVSSSPSWVRCALAVLMLSHLIPVWSFFQTGKLLKLCQHKTSEQRLED